MRRISRRRALGRVAVQWVACGLIISMMPSVSQAEEPSSVDVTRVAALVSSGRGSSVPSVKDVTGKDVTGTGRKTPSAIQNLPSAIQNLPSSIDILPASEGKVQPAASRSEGKILVQNGPVQTTAITDPAESTKGSIAEKDVRTLLKDAGFEPVRERLVPIYRITVGSGAQKYPAAVVLTPDGSLLWVVIILGSWDRPEALPAEKLLALLEANSSVGPAYFAYNSRTKIVSLARAYENRGLEPKRLKSSIDTLALIAHDTKPLWDVTEVAKQKRDVDVKPAVQKTEAPVSGPASVKSPQPTSVGKSPQHVGIWKCKLADKTGFELSLTNDGKYTLRVETPFGDQMHQGRYSLSDNVLSLVADSGGKLEAAVEWQKTDTFSFRDRSKPDNAAIVFHRD